MCRFCNQLRKELGDLLRPLWSSQQKIHYSPRIPNSNQVKGKDQERSANTNQPNRELVLSGKIQSGVYNSTLVGNGIRNMSGMGF